ncbi:MAG: glycosyltransferase family 4 protein [Sedimentisphaerales bacterium]|nr:glycosyltransferase family 4 protein [Sedimentisphaerales bacterium]
MKIAIFSRYPSDSRCPKGGVESVTVVLVKALAQLDDLDVHIITLEQKRTDISVEQDGNVTVHKLPGSRWPQILDIIVGPGKKQLVSYIKDLKPDILHTHETYGLGLGTFSIPHVFTVHGFDHANIIADSAKFGWLRSRLWKRMERRGLAAQKHIISITPYVRKMIEPLTGANIYDIENPVDERFFNIKHQPEPGRILYVGWINERKNTLGAVEAFAAIASRYAHAQLVIAGEQKEDAKYFNRVKECIDNNRLSDRVELLGHINHTQLEQELARTSLFFLPSRQENSPMAIAEAMATGIPVIASNRCGMPYMISEGKTGFLFDPESTDQMTQRLIQLLSSQQLCQQMGLAGRQMAMERFHPDVVAIRTKAVYEKIYTSH